LTDTTAERLPSGLAAMTEATAITARTNIAFFILLAFARGFAAGWGVVACNKARNKLGP
jgi:hypothetical protein